MAYSGNLSFIMEAVDKANFQKDTFPPEIYAIMLSLKGIGFRDRNLGGFLQGPNPFFDCGPKAAA
jgi:hypothetical protein